MKITGYLLLLLLLMGCEYSSNRECHIDPEIFCEPYAKWEAEMPPENAAKLRRMTRQDLRGLSFSFGMGVRNEFGLWQDNPITEFFRSCGVDHPDYMSTPFTLGFIAYLNDRPADMCDLGKQSVPPEPPPPPPGWQPNNSFKPTPLRGAA